MKDINTMPFHVIEKAEFENGKLMITFISGNKIICTPPNEEEYNFMKDIFIKRMPKDAVIIK
jgi:hypothetical protein